jgi:hypothetical protein
VKDSGDTTGLDTSKAAAPDLAWSLEGDDNAELDFGADLPRSVAGGEFSPPEGEPLPDDDEQAPGERYSWGLVWLRAALIVVVAAALAAVLVSSVKPDRHESAAPQSTSPDSAAFLREAAAPAVQDAYHDPEVCAYIRAGHTVQQAIEVGQRNGWVTLEQARAYVAAAVSAYCP